MLLQVLQALAVLIVIGLVYGFIKTIADIVEMFFLGALYDLIDREPNSSSHAAGD